MMGMDRDEKRKNGSVYSLFYHADACRFADN
jgi:hypothetical protein